MNYQSLESLTASLKYKYKDCLTDISFEIDRPSNRVRYYVFFKPSVEGDRLREVLSDVKQGIEQLPIELPTPIEEISVEQMWHSLKMYLAQAASDIRITPEECLTDKLRGRGEMAEEALKYLCNLEYNYLER